MHALAELLLLLNLIGQPFEAVRIVSGGILRGWQDLLFPTLMNILLMSVVGVTAGWAIGYYRDNESPLPMFWVRLAAIILSAAINCYRFAMHIKSDTQLYAAGQALLGVAPSIPENTVSRGGWCSFLPACLRRERTPDAAPSGAALGNMIV